MTLQQLIQTTEEIWVVLDIGVKEGSRYFGFVVATGSKILWKGNRKSLGNQNQMESLCTESSRGLTALHFLVRYIEYYDIKPRTDLILYFCNNNTLVGRIQWQQQNIVNNPNELLGPNFDIQMAIDKSLQELLIMYKCTHVWGHQDRKDKRKQTDRKK
eukprot:7261590-Ditylum_brightwellii.AAC.1